MKNFIIPKSIAIIGLVASMFLALAATSPIGAQAKASRPAEADMLHVVLLVAGNDGNIGNADMKDIAAMEIAINAAFAKDIQRVIYHDLTGANPQTNKFYSGPEIAAYLRALKIGPNDNVLVYHSGHGCITDKSRPEDSQMLVVDGGQIARKEIRDILKAKQPRALFILTDCCSSYVGGAAGSSKGRGTTPAPAVNVTTVRNLLLKPIGVVSITAAEDGTMAVATFQGENPGQAGSAFTVSLMRLWYRLDQTFTSWEQMFPILRAETQKASGGVHQARAFQINESGVIVIAEPVQQPTVQDDIQRRFRR